MEQTSGSISSLPFGNKLSKEEIDSLAMINLDDIFQDVFLSQSSDFISFPEITDNLKNEEDRNIPVPSSAPVNDFDGDEVGNFGQDAEMSITGSQDSSHHVLPGSVFVNSLSSLTKNLTSGGNFEFGSFSETSQMIGLGGVKGSNLSVAELTEAQKIERRERNREHAKRSRVRKKFLLESLQKSVDDLNQENEELKASIIAHLGPKGEALIAQCAPEVDSLYTNIPSRASTILEDPDYSLVKALQIAQQNFVITDACLPDNPIVYASKGFLNLTGYTLNQILGRNCRFLQGPKTDPRAVDKIRTAIARGEDASVCLLNYCLDGSTFWNQFFVAALRDARGSIVNYVGVQSKVSEEYAQLIVNHQDQEFSSAKSGHGGRRK